MTKQFSKQKSYILTTYIKSFSFLAFSNGILDLAFDDRVVLGPRYVDKKKFGRRFGINESVVDVPPVRDVGRVRVS